MSVWQAWTAEAAAAVLYVCCLVCRHQWACEGRRHLYIQVFYSCNVLLSVHGNTRRDVRSPGCVASRGRHDCCVRLWNNDESIAWRDMCVCVCVCRPADCIGFIVSGHTGCTWTDAYLCITKKKTILMRTSIYLSTCKISGGVRGKLNSLIWFLHLGWAQKPSGI